MTVPTETRVRSADGTELAVYETGRQNRPTIIAVHGYPDNHAVWDAVVPLLAEQFRVVTYDVRGCGASDQPRGIAPYRMERLTDDFVAVLDAVSPGEPVHVLAHDWGSIQVWPTLVDPRVVGRVRSFFSISGPSLDHAAVWLRGIRRRPGAVLRQLGDSWYIFAFQLPLLPERMAKSGFIDRTTRRLSARHAPPSNSADRTDGDDPVDGPPRQPQDVLNGIQLYRANMLRRLGRSRPQRLTIPVRVLAPRHDPHVTAALQTQAPAPFVDDLRTEIVDGGHWIVVQQPDLVADRVRAFVVSVER